SLNSLIRTNPELASEFLQNMSRIYRYVLQHKDKVVVGLQEELQFIKDYLFLMETRFGKGFQCEIQIEEESLEKGIVPVTLQILIENAIKHNSISASKPLHLRLWVDQDFLVMENNYQPKTMVEGSNKVGLENLNNLYQYLSETPISWEIRDGAFSIRIPLIER
ncbi:MAG: histidine kinase, partial [Bacteroidota bacterium]|nr:histidine kinase [Bacteroidota bacterium]MDX5430630.1 histidine kinase [Bacteroidota bacterium]MDX5469380.1 histidine kinase [Bacteroidota bacterium]